MKKSNDNNSVFGYKYNAEENKFTIVEEESKIVKAIFEFYSCYELVLEEIKELINNEKSIVDIIAERLFEICSDIKKYESVLNKEEIDKINYLYDNFDLCKQSKIEELFDTLINITSKISEEDLEKRNNLFNRIENTKKLYNNQEDITLRCKELKLDKEQER